MLRQLALGIATSAFLWLFARWLPVDRRQIISAIVIATIGEIVLSLGWGLYSYRHALIPLYVPPGHGLFYTLAAATASQAQLRRHATAITRGAVFGGTLLAFASLVLFDDVWGLLWWVAALLLIRHSRNGLLLSACFVYTILLEWAGTAIGNWRWAPEVPFVGLHSANPPAGVGLLYILLDLIVVAVTYRLTHSTIREQTSKRPRVLHALEAAQDGEAGAGRLTVCSALQPQTLRAAFRPPDTQQRKLAN